MIHVETPVWKKYSCILPCPNFKPKNNEVFFDTQVLAIKPEFHVTLIGYRLAQKIGELCSDEQKIELKDYLCNFVFQFSLLSDQRFLKKEYKGCLRWSCVELLSFENQRLFEEELSEIIGFKYSLVPHITTHTLSTDKNKRLMGIGIQTRAELQKYEIQI